MRDHLVLLLTALACAGAAWAFWYFSKEDGFAILGSIALISLFVDNQRLRKRLRQLEGDRKPPG